jgi:transglutaminase-like putative cysteine protease
MRLVIRHQTLYHYATPFNHAVQSLRLTPPSGRSQMVREWRIQSPGIADAVHYDDALGNRVTLVTPPSPTDRLAIIAEGVIDTCETAGVVGVTDEAAPPGVFLRETSATQASEAIATMARMCQRGPTLESLHTLLATIHESVAYDLDATHVLTTAADAFNAKRGVCQDHAHIFIAAARLLGIPARYVTGYLFLEDTNAHANAAEAHHAWAEAYVDELGWVGFDAANGVCPTERYARLAVGFDAASAAPVRGTLRGARDEALAVEVVVGAAQQ